MTILGHQAPVSVKPVSVHVKRCGRGIGEACALPKGVEFLDSHAARRVRDLLDLPKRMSILWGRMAPPLRMR